MYPEFFLTLITLPCVAGVALSKRKSVENAHKFAYKKGNNSIMHIIGSITIFGGMVEGVWPMNSQRKFLLCDCRCQSKSGITGLFERLHYSSIYKPSQWRTSFYE